MEYLEDVFITSKSVKEVLYKLRDLKNKGKNTIDSFSVSNININNLMYKIKLYEKDYLELYDVMAQILIELEKKGKL